MLLDTQLHLRIPLVMGPSLYLQAPACKIPSCYLLSCRKQVCDKRLGQHLNSGLLNFCVFLKLFNHVKFPHTCGREENAMNPHCQ